MKRAVDYISHIHIEEECLDLPYARGIMERAGLSVEVVPAGVAFDLQGESGPVGLHAGKKHLFLGRNRGKFLKSCPGTREYRCCGYQVLNIGMNCPMDCVYCILQAYLNNPWLSFFVNIDDLLAELEQAFAAEPARLWRIGTGEFTDSLVLDRWTGLSRILVEFFAKQPNGFLELKTKTVEIANLEGLDHGGRTIVSWSLNSPPIIARHELRAAALEERLAAAARCADWGYRLAFHFDPIVFYPGWEEGYAETIDRLFTVVPAEKIVWISMGGLRFIPSLKPIALARFPAGHFFYEEFVPGLDGKSRYFRTQRIMLYRRLLDFMSGRLAGRTCVYLCMENDEIWQEVFGFTPEEQGGLAAMLDRALVPECP